MDRRTFIQSSIGASLAAAAAQAQDLNPVQRLTTNLNPKIQHARNVALDILKPTPKQLEHGLRLHAESIVFDSYGFSPRAALDGDAYAKLVEANASIAELKDLREDMGMTRYVTEPAERREWDDAWNASGVTCIYQNAGEEGQDPLRMLKRLARYTYVTDMLSDVITKAALPDDVVAAKKQGKRCLYLTANGVPLIQDWSTVPDELRYVRVFYQLGIRMMHLTYQRRNMIGDGCAEKANAGLSDFGHSAIAEMNRVGITPDCAHSGWQTSLESAKISAKPVVASHTTVTALHPHIRSKPDEVIRAIADSGGYVGICCISRFLRREGDINVLLDHIDYVAKKFGPDHVAIGTDVAYSSQNDSTERKKIPKQPRGRKEFRSLWPDDDYVTTSKATNSIAWTNWPMFTVGLVQRGYSDDDIQKIIGGNVLRVARGSLK